MKPLLWKAVGVVCALAVVGGLAPLQASAQGPTLLVIDAGHTRVLRYDGTTGAFIDEFISPSSGGLSTPQDLLIGPDGNVYVSSWGNGSVKRYDGSTGAYLDDFVPSGSGGLSNPDHLAFGSDGHLYVSDRFAAQIRRYHGATGAPLGSFVSDFRLGGFVAFTFGPDGHLYASMFNPAGGLPQCILRYNGQTGAFIDVFACPNAHDYSSAFGGLAFGPDSHLYASRFHHGEVWRLDGSSGAFLGALHCPGDTVADYLVFGPAGKLFVNTQTTNNVSHFDVQTGQCLGPFLSGGNIDFTKGLVFTDVHPATQVAIDIKLGSNPASINPKSRGKIPVAILTTDTFDATTVDPLSVSFGPDGATEAHGRGHVEDADGDGDRDLVLHFNSQDTGIQCGDTSASLTGQTFDGQTIQGSDSIATVGCK